MGPESDNDDEQRLQKILQRAFAGPATPLKKIPTKKGRPRRIRKVSPPAAPDREKAKKIDD